MVSRFANAVKCKAEGGTRPPKVASSFDLQATEVARIAVVRLEHPQGPHSGGKRSCSDYAEVLEVSPLREVCYGPSPRRPKQRRKRTLPRRVSFLR